MSPSSIGVIVALVVLTMGPAFYAWIVALLAGRLSIEIIPTKTYRTSVWVYVFIIVGLTFLCFIFFVKGQSSSYYVVGTFFCLLGGITGILMALTAVQFDSGRIVLRDAGNVRRLDAMNIISADTGLAGISIVHTEGKEVIQWGISRPWEILAVLNFIIRKNMAGEKTSAEGTGI